MILEKGYVPKAKKMQEIQEVKNMESCFNEVRTYRKDLNLKFIFKLHKILFYQIDDKIAGKIRDHNANISGSSFKPPSFILLKPMLKDFLNWYNKNKKNLHPLALASLVHLRFVTIHPFSDGNGRISRLLMNFIFLKHKYPMLNIKYKERLLYYDVLEDCQIQEKQKNFIDFIVKEYIKAHNEFI